MMTAQIREAKGYDLETDNDRERFKEGFAKLVDHKPVEKPEWE